MNNNSNQSGILYTDWLASNPIFYNEFSGAVSQNINDVIDFRNFEFHPEGLNNYLDFGYSVFEQTPVKGVKFLRHSSELYVQDNKIRVNYLKDPAEKLAGKTYSESEVIDLLQSSIQNWEQSVVGEIIIPTSGGYDSRLLNNMIRDKSRIRSFTYGVSSDQSKSFEVVFAKKIAEILRTKWQHIQLGEYHTYFDEWNDLFGISTHAHGMYQMEFYHKIKSHVTEGKNLLSGIIGDAWAGSVLLPGIETPDDVFKLGYSHNMRADSSQSLLKSDRQLLHSYLQTNKEKLKDPRFKVIEAMRFKIILLCYLLKVPKQLGFKPWSPFLDQEIALSMLNLPEERRINRAWQADYFKKHSLQPEALQITSSKKNTLNKNAIHRIPPKPLDIKLLSEIINPRYIQWINKNLLTVSSVRNLMNTIVYFPKAGGLLRKFGLKDEKLSAYLAYLTLKPLEYLIIKRNNS